MQICFSPPDSLEDSGDEDGGGALLIDDSKGKKTAKKGRHNSSKKAAVGKITGFLVYGKQRKAALAMENPDLKDFAKEILPKLREDWANLAELEKRTWEAKAELVEKKLAEQKVNSGTGGINPLKRSLATPPAGSPSSPG